MAQFGRESFFWHKLHSLTGIIPVGYYLVQHLTLNTFSLAGPEKFNAIIKFFEGMPPHLLYALKVFGVWLPLLFHAVYGIFIVSRGLPNVGVNAYRWRENYYYTWQRISGIVAFAFLAYHMTSTSIASSVSKCTGGPGAEGIIYYDQWASKLASGGTYLVLAVYVIGILASTYHFSYGLWSFCIRWGITVSDSAQAKLWRVSQGSFVALTLLGFAALGGFFLHKPETERVEVRNDAPTVSVSAPLQP